MSLDVIVLAAGMGKRMRSSLPKVLQPLAGRPLLSHVLDAARALSPRRILVVHGHGAGAVRAAFPDAGDIEWVLQAEQLGTGHAVQQAAPHLDKGGDALILYGDVPLVRAETLRRLVEASKERLAVLTTELTSPSLTVKVTGRSAGFGRGWVLLYFTVLVSFGSGFTNCCVSTLNSPITFAFSRGRKALGLMELLTSM